ncbi:MAG TPA: hypothetical protein VGQ45_03590 [Gaiellales bacterium]|nr:hypothetical protein [Gaiellales bacterium]
MRPELTLGRATAHVVRRWWLLPLCAVLVAVAATTLSGHHISDAKATARVHIQDTTVTYQFQGQPQPFTAVHSVQDLTESEFVDSQVASAAAAALKNGTTARQYLDHLGFAALDGTTIQLSYSDNSSEAVAAARLNAYVKALVHQRISSEKKALLQAATTLQTNGGNATAVARLHTAANNLSQGIHPNGKTSTTAARTLPGAALLAGGILAGIILGIAIALGVGQADPRIRSTGDLRAAGVRSLAVDPAKPDSVEALRALAEVGGIDAKGGVVAVVTPRGDHGGGLSRTLAESFAQSGRPATWLSESGIARSGEAGWTQVDAGTAVLSSLPRLRDALTGAREGEVVVVDAPALLDHPAGLVSTAVATVTVLSLRRGRSTWSDLESMLELLEDAVVSGRVRVCLDRGRKASATSLLSRATAAARPVEQPTT